MYELARALLGSLHKLSLGVGFGQLLVSPHLAAAAALDVRNAVGAEKCLVAAARTTPEGRAGW
jgi:hypothetical protein